MKSLSSLGFLKKESSSSQNTMLLFSMENDGKKRERKKEIVSSLSLSVSFFSFDPVKPDRYARSRVRPRILSTHTHTHTRDRTTRYYSDNFDIHHHFNLASCINCPINTPDPAAARTQGGSSNYKKQLPEK